MEKLFVTYELAKILLDKGFDEPCMGRFRKGKFQNNVLGNWYRHNSDEISIAYISAPLYQQVVDWLREVHNIHLVNVVSFTDESSYLYKNKALYSFSIQYRTELCYMESIVKGSSYYKAIGDAITDALKLIPDDKRI